METIQGIAKWLAAEGTVIVNAPVSFLVSVALVGVAIYFIIKAFFKERISVLGLRLEHSQDLVNEYKTKLQGASPDEAARAIHALQERIQAIEPRRLTDDKSTKLGEVLRRRPERFGIHVTYDGSCGDCNQFASQLAGVLQGAAGWIVHFGMVIGPGVRPAGGVAIGVGNPQNLLVQEKLLADGLAAAGIQFEYYKDSDFTLLVTAQLSR